MTRFLSAEFVRADLSFILALQKTRSWNAEEMRVPGFFVDGSEFGLTSLLVSDHFCNAQKTWRSDERCTAVLFGFSMVCMLLTREKTLKNTRSSKLLCEGRRSRATRFYIAGSLKIELGLLCTGDD